MAVIVAPVQFLPCTCYESISLVQKKKRKKEKGCSYKTNSNLQLNRLQEG